MSKILPLSFMRNVLTLGLIGFGLSGLARAELNVTVEGTGAETLPIAIIPFVNERASLESKAITPVVQADLARTGVFQFIDTAFLPTPISEPSQLKYGDWQSRGAQAVVMGSVASSPQGGYTVRFRLMDTVKQHQLAGFSYQMTASQYRQVAHQIADIVYEKLTGQRGVFNTQIAYVLKKGKRYELQIADADGQGGDTILTSNASLMSPTWSPDGKRLAYVSFETKKPVIYVHTLATGQRKAIAAFKGNNSAPAWSPDGRRMAVVLTQEGLSQLYVMNSEGGGLTRLASSDAIDTEPTWSPDGQWLYFTSDRGGSPQIYKIPSSGGQVQRVTFEGSYNVSPDISPDGKKIAYLRRHNGRFSIVLQDLDSGVSSVLTQSSEDESPSFSPNGRMILYATREGGRGILAAISTDGRVRQRLSVTAGDVREPAWGPLPPR